MPFDMHFYKAGVEFSSFEFNNGLYFDLGIVSDQVSTKVFKIDLQRLSERVGLVLIKKANKMHVDDFVDVWKCSLPEDDTVTCEIEQIYGSAYLGDEKRPTVNFLDPLTLPTDPLRLFERLFRIKKKVINFIARYFHHE